jgi:hypothetical protein
MNCKQYRTEIEEVGGGAGKLPPPAGPHATAAASHAAVCAECRTFGDETAALRGLISGLARVDAPPDFEFRLRARISAADSSRSRGWSHNLLPRAAWLAAAGCLALVAVLALQTRNSQTPAPPESAALPAVEQTAANPVATASAETTSRDLPGEMTGETHAAELTTSPADLNGTVVAKRRPRAASLEAAVAARPEQRRPATASQPSRETVAAGSERPARTETNSLGMIAAPISVSPAIPLPVSADERPLQVLFKDTQGVSRVVNVDPVAFGSNEVGARPTNVTFTKTTRKQGVW